jgi:hypothetical protein
MARADWWAEGDLFEGCNCAIVCPCHLDFRQNSTHETCENAWGIHIDRGEFGAVTLDDLNAMVLVSCPGPSMFDGNWAALVYLDDRATPEQADGLGRILTGEAGGPWGRIAQFFSGGKAHSVQSASFRFEKSDRRRSLEVGGLVSLEVEAIRGADPEGVVTINNLFNLLHGPEHVVASSQVKLDDQGLRWDNSGTHGLYSRFRWGNG